MENKSEWKRVIINNSTDVCGTAEFYPTFLEVLRRYCIYPKEEITIKRKDGYTYKFLFQWQNEDICGIDVYRRNTE